MFQPHAPNSRHETLGETTSTSRGTSITTGAGPSKGSWVDLGATTSFAYDAITVCLTRGAAADHLFDIGVSDGSNRWILCADLHFANAKLVSEHSCQIYIPVHVPAAAQVSAREQNSTGTSSADILVIGHSAGLGGAPGYSRCVALFTPSSSRGIAIDPGAAANTKGSWAQMTSSCPNDIAAMFGLIGYNGDIARGAEASMLMDIGIGAGGSEFVAYPNAPVKWSTTRDGPSNCPRIPLFACDVSAGTRIAARGQCSITTGGDRTVDLALYGLVK